MQKVYCHITSDKILVARSAILLMSCRRFVISRYVIAYIKCMYIVITQVSIVPYPGCIWEINTYMGLIHPNVFLDRIASSTSAKEMAHL